MKTRLLGLGLALAAVSALGGCGVVLDDSPGGLIFQSDSAVVVDDGGYGHHHGYYDDNTTVVVQQPATTVIQAPSNNTGAQTTTPIIQSFTANPSNVTNGQPITFTVVATDPGRGSLQFNWSSTGGTLSTNTGRVVTWTPPSDPGTYTVSTIITNANGGAVTGSQNLVVQAGGLVAAKPIVQPSALPVAATPAPVAVTPVAHTTTTTTTTTTTSATAANANATSTAPSQGGWHNASR